MYLHNANRTIEWHCLWEGSEQYLRQSIWCNFLGAEIVDRDGTLGICIENEFDIERIGSGRRVAFAVDFDGRIGRFHKTHRFLANVD